MTISADSAEMPTPASMSMDEFFKALETHCKRYPWVINKGGSIRTNDDIDDPFTTDCPITALALALTGHGYSVAQYRRAAADIGLGDVLREEIVRAADRSFIRYDAGIRERLKAVLINNPTSETEQ